MRRLFLIVLLHACSQHPDAAGSKEKDKEAAVGPQVVLSPAGKPEIRVAVKVARNDPERQRGLMFVEHLSDDEGMLFLFEQEEDHGFWMKNTLIPLDMIFIRSDGTVAGIVENATPRSLVTRRVGVPSQFVLEVNGGWSRPRGIVGGTRVRFENLP